MLLAGAGGFYYSFSRFSLSEILRGFCFVFVVLDENHFHFSFLCLLVFICLLQQADESLAFEEQILEAAKAIAAATSALVKSAATAQRELVASGVVGHKLTK